MVRRKSRLVISKTPGGYYRVYKEGPKWAIPFSPKEFITKADAKKWLASRR